MSKNILIDSYQRILRDTKLIRIAVITSFFHSLVFILYILYQTYALTQLDNWNINIDLLTKYINFLFWTKIILIMFIVLAIIAAIWFFLLPPIAKASIIYYLEEKKGVWKALSKWIKKFFPMFEFNALISLFNIMVFIIAASRFYVLWIINNPFVIFIMTIWFIISILSSLLLPYAGFLIVLKNHSPTEAIKKSITLSLDNFLTTAKFVLIWYLLLIRFFINILIVLWIPTLIIFLFFKLNIYESEYTKYIIYSTLAILIIIWAYINAIIEAFFVTYWYKVFKHIENK